MVSSAAARHDQALARRQRAIAGARAPGFPDPKAGESRSRDEPSHPCLQPPRAITVLGTPALIAPNRGLAGFTLLGSDGGAASRPTMRAQARH